MHVYYKFGLLLIFILSLSTNCSRAAPTTNHSSYEDNPDDYSDEDYSDADRDYDTMAISFDAFRLISETTTTTFRPIFHIPRRSNHVLEPICPRDCLCLEDFKYIQCSNAHLTHVPADLPRTALIVNLSHNFIRELRAENFMNCTKIQEINLSWNELKTIEKETFTGLSRLQRLRLSNNYLTNIEPHTFEDATDLRLLDLSNNTIELRNDGSFLNQPDLLELSCSNCSWTEIYDDTFANLTSLTTLRLDKNDFNRKINTRAFTPLRNLIKLKLPELDQYSIQELCDLLKSIDNISFKHFDVSCFELVLGTSFNESVITATETTPTKTTQASGKQQNVSNKKHTKNMADEHSSSSGNSSNLTLPLDIHSTTIKSILTAGVHAGADVASTQTTSSAGDEPEKPYQVPITQEAINILLICIMIIAVIGIIIGLICRKDIGGIKTKCCRTRKPEPKDQVHPAEEIPLNKLA